MSSIFRAKYLLYRRAIDNPTIYSDLIMPGNPDWQITGESIDVPAGSSYVYGTPLNDFMQIGVNCNGIYAKEGDDYIVAGDNCTYISGDDGDDYIIVGESCSDIYGGNGNDYLELGERNDNIYAGPGDDYIIAGELAHNLYGQEGNDTIFVNGSAAAIWGDGYDSMDDGDDHISVGDSSYGIYGNGGDDAIDTGNDCTGVLGGSGNDTITVGDNCGFMLESPELIKGIYGDSEEASLDDGDDTISAGSNAQNIYGGYGDDTISAGDNAQYIYGAYENPTEFSMSDKDIITLGNFVSYIYGNDDDDYINAKDNASYIFGDRENSDIYNGLQNRDGDDTIIVGDNASYIFGNGSNDIIKTGDNVTYIYGDNINERAVKEMGYHDGNDIIITGDLSSYIYGNGGNDHIEINNNCKEIYGGTGDDTIIAGTNASYIYGDRNEPEDIILKDGQDTITTDSFASYIYGNGGDDTITVKNDSHNIYGDEGNDTISAGDNAESIYGGEGNDTITAQNGATQIDGGSGDDLITVGDSATTLNGGAGNDKIHAGNYASGVYGDEDNDLIVVKDNASTISGGAGNDTIVAGTNADGVDGGDGNDIIISNYIPTMQNASGGDGTDIIIGSKDAPSLEVLYRQNITDFEALLRAFTDDVAPLDFTSHEGLEADGIRIEDGGSSKNVSLSDIWEYVPQMSTPQIDLYTSSQNGVELELELWAPKGMPDFVLAPTIYEKDLGDGRGVELELISPNYAIKSVIGETGLYGHIEERKGDWCYILDRAYEHSGAGGIAEADLVTVEITGYNGAFYEYAFPVNIVDDEPQITIAPGQDSADFYFGADRGSLEILVNGSPAVLNAQALLEGNPLEIAGVYGTLLLTPEVVENNPDRPVFVKARLEYLATPGLKDSGEDRFSFRIVDGDGDIAEANADFTNHDPLDEPTADLINLPVVTEKAIGEALEITLATPQYSIIAASSQNQYGHVEQIDGKWFYILDRNIDSGPIQGPNEMADADVIKITVVDEGGYAWDFDAALSVIDDVPEITVAKDDSSINFYYGADGGRLTIFANDQPVTFDGTLENGLVIEGKYGSLRLGASQATSAFGMTTSLEYVPGTDTSGVDVFRFQITDNDGDMALESVAFSVDVPEPGSPVASIDQLTFHEQNLALGTEPDYVNLVQNGAMLYAQNAGVRATQIRFEGQSYAMPESGFFNLTTSEGVFSAWQDSSQLAYSFILANSLPQSGDAELLKFEAILQDSRGNIFDGNMINVNVIDDRPVLLEDKSWTLDAQDNLASGNATEYFMAGADGGLFSWEVADKMLALANEYGSLTLENNGAYAFELNADYTTLAEPLVLAYGFEDIDGDVLSGAIYINF